ncbi:MAG TPA: histidine kinase, partial [Ktedonobacterales bacterium]
MVAGNGEMQRLRGFARNIGLFWSIITYAGLAIITTFVFAKRPELLSQPKGWAILALVAIEAVWYTIGFPWVMRGNPTRHYAETFGRRINRLHWRGIVYWASMLGLTLLLIQLDATYVYELWAIYGISFAIMAMPQALIVVVPTVFVLMKAFDWLPHTTNLTDLAGFGAGLLLFAIYSAFAYLPYVLIINRFERERMFTELERSHQALAEAHQQLGEAAERDRELAVLRERGRLARDLHDTIGHSLVLGSVKLEAALRLRAVDPARADHEIAATQRILRDTMTELRAAIANLRSPALAREPLGDALSRVAREAALRNGWQISADIAPDLDTLDDRSYEALLRVGAEAIANAERHAHATTLALQLCRDGCEVVLRVRDNGAGMPQPAPVAAASAASAHALEGG